MNNIRPIQIVASSYYEINPISPMTEFKSWLIAVESHGQTGSEESQKSLLQLAIDPPNCSFLSQDIQEEVTKIYNLLQNETWTPELSPLCSIVLGMLTKNPKKLN